MIAERLLRALSRRGTRDEPERLVLRIGSDEHVVRVTRSRRARRLTLRVKPAGEIVLTAPPRAALAAIADFAERHAGWVVARLARLAPRIPFAPDAIVPFRGVPHRIVHRPDRRGVVWGETGADGHHELHVAGGIAHLERRLVAYFTAEARHDLAKAVERHAARLGRPVKRICLRDPATRWGSCTAAGVLSFSWRLVLAPPFVLDYLAAHEVAHLREMNHSARFWRLVHDLFPETPSARAWLAANGAALHTFGPPAGRKAPAASPPPLFNET